MKFIYSSGQRVLDGYTLKRGIGRGGFGEVYYALSDGGKEVALKLVRGQNLEMELRGMAQCLNLKHPNLLALYDLRTDGQGDRWVVMEYISGEPLAEVLNRHPQGLPEDLARQWFIEMARGVGYLHDHGIVHRDLKPANIFLEGGTVKVGDYGLSKFISSSQHTAQTQSVGTVHYMAPEISTGNYNKQIDIYAAGIILYEMLTGRVPFDGESTGEILMKHLTSAPDLSKLPAAYVPIVGKALAKNPAHRFATMGEMARAVEAVGAAAEVVPISERPGGRGTPVRERPAVEAVAGTPLPAAAASAGPPASLRGQLAELCGSLALTALFVLVAFTIWTAVASVDDHVNIVNLGTGFFLTVAICWAVLIPAKAWNGRPGDSGLRRTVLLLFGVLVGLGAYWLDWGTVPGLIPDAGATGPMPQTITFFGHRSGIPLIAGYISYFGLALFALRWWKLADRHRSHRFSFAPVLAAGFWAFVLLLVWPWAEVAHGPLPLLLASGIIQLVSPWEQPPPPAAKRVRLRYA
jgi:hypothetical protein